MEAEISTLLQQMEEADDRILALETYEANQEENERLLKLQRERSRAEVGTIRDELLQHQSELLAAQKPQTRSESQDARRAGPLAAPSFSLVQRIEIV